MLNFEGIECQARFGCRGIPKWVSTRIWVNPNDFCQPWSLWGRFLEVTSPYYWHLFRIPIPTHLLLAPLRTSARECIAVSVVGSPGHHIRQTVPAECGWLHRWKSKIDTQNSLVRWFQPLWKFENLPQIGVKIKRYWKPPPSRHVWKEIYTCSKAHHFGYPADSFRG